MTKLVLDKVANIVGKGENDGYHHFLVFPQCFTTRSRLLTTLRNRPFENIV